MNNGDTFEVPPNPQPAPTAVSGVRAVRQAVRGLAACLERFVVRAWAPPIKPRPGPMRVRIERFVIRLVAPHITPVPGPVRIRPRRGHVFDPPRPAGVQDWQPLLGRRVQAGDSGPAWDGVEPYAVTGRVREIRFRDGTPLLVLKSGQGRIVIDPGWWRITVLDGCRAFGRCRGTLPAGGESPGNRRLGNHSFPDR